MRAYEASSKNEAVIQQAQNEVRSAQATIKFLEDELQKLQLAQQRGYGSPMQGEASGSSPRGQGQGQGQGGPMTPSRSGASMGGGGTMVSPTSSRREGMGMLVDRPLPPPPTGEAPGEMRKEQKNYTQLGGYIHVDNRRLGR